MCAELRAKGVPQIIVASPSALADTYTKMIESLSRIADAGLTLHIEAREPRPSHN